jgi:hypothetical protein
LRITTYRGVMVQSLVFSHGLLEVGRRVNTATSTAEFLWPIGFDRLWDEFKQALRNQNLGIHQAPSAKDLRRKLCSESLTTHD